MKTNYEDIQEFNKRNIAMALKLAEYGIEHKPNEQRILMGVIIDNDSLNTVATEYGLNAKSMMDLIRKEAGEIMEILK